MIKEHPQPSLLLTYVVKPVEACSSPLFMFNDFGKPKLAVSFCNDHVGYKETM